MSQKTEPNGPPPPPAGTSLAATPTGTEADRATQPVSILDGPEQILGTQVFDFELVEVLGAGGMAAVYKGRHTLTGQLVAVKVLPPELALHKELKLRFLEEAKALALLDHPNIVTLNNFTVDASGRFCLVMQYIDGVNFEQRIREAGKVDAREAVRVCIEAAKALEYAHARGVIHRDMKPSNILLRADGSVKVTDFGIAKIAGGTRMTSTGQTMGTVRYMSPEQVRGLEVDGRSDLYSLGITLYEALSGDTPFVGDHQFEVMKRQVSDEPPSLRSRGVTVSSDLEDVLMCCLEKDRAARFPDAASLRAAFESVVEGARPGTARRPVLPRAFGQRRRSRRSTIALSIAVAATGAVAGLWILLGPPGGPAAPRASSSGEDAVARSGGRAEAPGWPQPHPVARIHATAFDQKFGDAAVRILAANPRDPTPLREAVARARADFPRYLAGRGVAASAAELTVRPLNLVVVPQALMNRADLWADVQPGSDYPTRYFARDATLFIADAPGFERRDLVYGLALHLCAPMKRLSNPECTALAEGFEAWSGSDAGVAPPGAGSGGLGGPG